MKHRSSLHLAALASVMLSSTALAASARYNTAFAPNDLLPDDGADPLKAKIGICNIGNSTNSVGGGTSAKTAAIIGGSFSGVRKSDGIDGRDLAEADTDDAGLGLNLALPVAAAGSQAYLQ